MFMRPMHARMDMHVKIQEEQNDCGRYSRKFACIGTATVNLFCNMGF